MMRFRREIRRFRRRANLTQQDLAQRVGVSTRTIQRWEGGESKPRGLSAKALVRALDLEGEERD